MFHLVFCPIIYIGSWHPYSVFVMVNLSISSSLLVSSYTVAKTSVYLNVLLYLFVYLLILLLFILYPLLFITFICTLYSIVLVVNYSSICKGISLSNLYICVCVVIMYFLVYMMFLQCIWSDLIIYMYCVGNLWNIGIQVVFQNMLVLVCMFVLINISIE